MMTSLSLFTEKSPEKTEIRGFGSFKLASVFEKKSLEVIKKKNISKDYQFYGVWIAQNLDDFKNISLYIRLAKYQDKSLLEHAISYVKDYPDAKSKSRLFLWYLKGKMKPVALKKKALDIEVKLFKSKPSKAKLKQLDENILIAQDLATARQMFLNQIEKYRPKLYFKQSAMIDIFKIDFYFKEKSIALDFVEKDKENLSHKLYLNDKKKKLMAKKIRYYAYTLKEYNSDMETILDLLFKSNRETSYK